MRFGDRVGGGGAFGTFMTSGPIYQESGGDLAFVKGWCGNNQSDSIIEFYVWGRVQEKVWGRVWTRVLTNIWGKIQESLG